ncbi:Prophage Clp protease-like protein [Escherichia coli]|nr:Prophage Clp protease-like protein [Escherichia coli]
MVWTRPYIDQQEGFTTDALPQKFVLMPVWHHLTGAVWCVRRWPDNRVITITARKGFFYA